MPGSKALGMKANLAFNAVPSCLARYPFIRYRINIWTIATSYVSSFRRLPPSGPPLVLAWNCTNLCSLSSIATAFLPPLPRPLWPGVLPLPRPVLFSSSNWMFNFRNHRNRSFSHLKVWYASKLRLKFHVKIACQSKDFNTLEWFNKIKKQKKITLK